MITNEPPNQDHYDGPTDSLTMPSADNANRCQILLEELIHLIGLFLIHSRQNKGEQAMNVLFDQMVRHLEILRNLPDHDGGILIRRVDCKKDMTPGQPDYMVLFGNLILHGAEGAAANDKGGHKRTKHLQSALNQTFECFAEQAMHSLYLQMPGDEKEEIERLRLSMNIISRFHFAAQEGVSITFRYNQRTLTVPLIPDAEGVPDPNLTLVAALNGLSAANARALITQALAFQSMSRSGDRKADLNRDCVSSYNQIFRVRSLRSQILKPPIEVNNLPWLDIRQLQDADAACRPTFKEEKNRLRKETPADPSPAMSEPDASNMSTADKRMQPEDLEPYVDLADQKISSTVAALWAEDYGDLAPLGLGQRFVSLTRLLYTIDKNCQDPSVIDGVLDLLRHRLAHVPDDVLNCMVAKRQGLKINIPGRTVLVGMVHPRLFDLISLVKERIGARQRMAVVGEMAFDFDLCHINALADGFGLSEPDAHHILRLLKDCFGADGSFVRSAFESRVDIMAQHENAIFEILWCFLKETPHRVDRLNFLNAFQLIIARLNHPKQALQFLMADICQLPSEINYTDRNAFALSNILLHSENKELYVDISRTPDDVLNMRRSLNVRVRRYAAWRLEIDQIQFVAKLRNMHQAVQHVLCKEANEADNGFEASFLLALEREAYLFCAMVGGHIARKLLREALATYGDPGAQIFSAPHAGQYLTNILDQLQLIISCLGRAGHSEDIQRLNALGKIGRKMMGLNAHPAHRLRVKQIMKHAVKACRAIASRG